MHRIQVEFPKYVQTQHEIWFSEDRVAYFYALKRNLNTRQWWVLTDETVLNTVYPEIQKLLPEHKLCVVPEGDAAKNLNTCQKIWQQWFENNTDRNAILICLGGGMISDLGAFAAANWKRGIRFVFIPTTLLSMIDASIGGKTGINFSDGKNILGQFAIPSLVITDLSYLRTLPKAQIRAGFAEALKHGLVADAVYWKRISALSLDNQEWEYVLFRSIMIKSEIIRQDPDEQWIRKSLNFGHSIGHALESLCLQRNIPLLHGEAVALGMRVEAGLSTKFAGLPYDAFQKINARIKAYDFPLPPLDFTQSELLNQWISFLNNDKKNQGSSIRMALISAPGIPVYDVEVPESEAILATQSLFAQFNQDHA